MPTLERVFRQVYQLTNSRSGAFPEFCVEIDCSNEVFVRVYELPLSSPRFCPHPEMVNIQSAPTVSGYGGELRAESDFFNGSISSPK